jgi:hypothetical protein
MQTSMTRPTDPTHIAYAGTPNEMWWSGGEWVKAPVSSPATPNLGQVVQVYNAIRDARTAKRKAYEAEDLALEEDQHKLTVLMLELLTANGAKSIATDFGTVYRTEKIKPSAADWTAIYGWINENPDRFELLEKRLKSTFIKEFMEENEGAVPPGVNVHREYEVSVRRPNVAGQPTSGEQNDR